MCVCALGDSEWLSYFCSCLIQSYSNHDLVCTTYLSTEADMKRELERKEQEKKRSPKVDFISSGVQPPINPSIVKISGMVHINECCALL